MSDTKDLKEILASLTDEELKRAVGGEFLRRKSTTLDGPPLKLASFEEAADASMFDAHDAVMSEALRQGSDAETKDAKPCPKCGRLCKVRTQKRPRRVRSASGVQIFRRNHHWCHACEHGFFPLDAELGLPKVGELTPGLREKVLDMALTSPYEEAAQRWKVHHRVAVSVQLMSDVVEGTEGLSDALNEALLLEIQPPLDDSDALVVQNDGSMVQTREEGWKEAQVGVIYRAGKSLHGEKSKAGKPGVRGQLLEAHKVSRLADRPGFTKDLKRVLKAYGATSPASKVVWVSDGAKGNWSLCESLCPWALQILDWYHLMLHVEACAKALFEGEELLRTMWLERVKSLAYDGHAATFLEELQACWFIKATEAETEALKDFTGYVKSNRKRLDYPAARALGAPMGSGAVESAHKSVIQSRMKLQGQRWSMERAKGMVRLRAAYKTAGPERFASLVTQQLAA